MTPNISQVLKRFALHRIPGVGKTSVVLAFVFQDQTIPFADRDIVKPCLCRAKRTAFSVMDKSSKTKKTDSLTRILPIAGQTMRGPNRSSIILHFFTPGNSPLYHRNSSFIHGRKGLWCKTLYARVCRWPVPPAGLADISLARHLAAIWRLSGGLSSGLCSEIRC